MIQIFRRYATEHLHLRQPGFGLRDERGELIGYVDRLALRGNRLCIEGWCEAERIAVVVEGQRTQTEPNLQRSDVTALRGGDPARALGFLLDVPVGSGPAMLSVETGALRYIHPLQAFAAADLRAARRRLIGPFLRDLACVLPAALRWLVTRDPAARARIKAALRFSDVAPAAPTMTARLFLEDILNDAAAQPQGRAGQAPLDGLPRMPEDLSQTGITLVLPVWNAFDLLPEVLDRVVRHTDLPWRLVVVEDASTDDRVRPFLRGWVAAQDRRAPGRVTLIEHPENRGFIRSVNAALEVAAGFDDHVVLLNSDAFVPAGWARRLIRPILVHEDVASVTPMSNDAEILSVPVICRRSVLTPGEADRIDALAATFHPDAELAVAPTGVGFCMAMNARYLRQVPQLDTAFGRGYGEEVDWCQKVRRLGGRHLALPGLFVEHRGGTSFGSAEKLKLVQANNAVISRRYPAYDQEVQDFIRHDPLATPRLALAIAWAAERQAAAEAEPGAGQGAAMPVYLAHSLGGGADLYLVSRIEGDLARGGSAIVLRVGGPYRWRVELHTASGTVSGVTHDFRFVQRLLAPVMARRVVYSCGVGDPDPVTLPEHLLALGQGPDHRIEVLFHDFLPISPSYTLMNAQGLHTGLPPAADRDSAHQSRRPDGRRMTLAEWQAAWGALLQAADDIVVFSASSRALVAGTWPQIAPAITVRPHGLLHAVPRIAPPDRAGRPPVIGVLGNIGHHKGAGVLADLSADLAQSREAELVLIGKIDPAYALVPPALVHGPYQVRDLPDLVARYGIGCWLIPSIWPETFSYATHEVLATGLPVWCFDLGAQAEAVSAAVRSGAPGGVLPLTDGRPDLKGLLDRMIHSAAHEAL